MPNLSKNYDLWCHLVFREFHPHHSSQFQQGYLFQKLCPLCTTYDTMVDSFVSPAHQPQFHLCPEQKGLVNAMVLIFAEQASLDKTIPQVSFSPHRKNNTDHLKNTF